MRLWRCFLMVGFVVITAGSLCFAGETNQEPIALATGEGAKSPKQPQLAVTDDGVVHVTFGIGDTVFYCRSEDGGKTYSAADAAFRCQNLSLGMRRGPRIVATGKSVVITVIGGPQGKGRDGDLQAWRLADDKQEWTGPVTINGVSASAREGLHGMATGPDGTVWCTWLDLRTKKTEVYAAASKDDGQTWGPNICVYRSPGGSVCECCHPSIAVGPKGQVHVLFRNSLEGLRDMYLVTSADGETFAAAKKLGAGSWKLDACPMDGGMLAVNGKGQVLTVWRREKGVFSTIGADGKEASLGTGEQPFVAALPAGSITVWTSRRAGELWMQANSAKRATRLATEASDPVVAASAQAGGPVIVCWEGTEHGRRAVFAQRVH